MEYIIAALVMIVIAVLTVRFFLDARKKRHLGSADRLVQPRRKNDR